jgi:hypothetical protein
VLRAIAKTPWKTVQHDFNNRLAAECRDLCGQLQRYLPHELGGRVYGHLVQEVTICVEDLEAFEDPASFVEPEGFENANLLSPCGVDVKTRHVFAKTWYRDSRFFFADYNTSEESFGNDIWGLGLVPENSVRKGSWVIMVTATLPAP